MASAAEESKPTTTPPAKKARLSKTEIKQKLSSIKSFKPPRWAAIPKQRLKLVVHRGKELVKELPIHKKSYYTFGRNGAAADIVLDHKSISRVHAALVHHKNGTVVVIDLGSAHGTRVQNKKLARKKPLTIEFGHIIRFGASSRTYRVMPVLSASDSKPPAAAAPAPAPIPELKPIKPPSVQTTNSGAGKFATLVKPKVVTLRRKRKIKKGATARALAVARKKSTASRMRAQPLLTVVPKTVAKNAKKTATDNKKA